MTTNNNRLKQLGFTLLELLVSIAIIGILVALSGPSFRAYSAQNSIDNAARAFESQLNLARTTALSTRGESWLCLTTAPPNVICTAARAAGTTRSIVMDGNANGRKISSIDTGDSGVTITCTDANGNRQFAFIFNDRSYTRNVFAGAAPFPNPGIAIAGTTNCVVGFNPAVPGTVSRTVIVLGSGLISMQW